MSKISIKNIVESIYLVIENKTGADLASANKKIVKFLNKNKLLSKSTDILKELEKQIDKKDGRVKMKVKSSTKIVERKRKELEREMKYKYNAKEIEGIYLEDKSLLGGMKIEVGEDVLDMTYRNILNQLEKYLIHK